MSSSATSNDVFATSIVARPTGAPVRRVITGHTTEGKAKVLVDTPVEPRPFAGKGPHFFTDLFWTDGSLADNGVVWKDTVNDHVAGLVGPEGSSFRAAEFPPGAVFPFHRTVSVDYVIVMHGSLTVILDDNERVKLNAGDVLIQRGTIHGWHNEGTEWARVFAVMLPAEKVKIGDKVLE